MIQFIIKFLLVLVYAYISFHFFRIIFTKEIYVRYPFKWLKNNIENFIPITTSEINISPDTISLNIGRWRGISSFNIYNKTSEEIYDIYVKLEIEGLGIQSENIKVTAEDYSELMAVPLGSNVSANPYLLQLRGTDGKDKEFVYLILYNLPPHESQSFRVGLEETSNENTNRVKIAIKLIKSSKSPVQISSQPNAVDFPFKLTEQVKIIRRMTVLLKKN